MKKTALFYLLIVSFNALTAGKRVVPSREKVQVNCGAYSNMSKEVLRFHQQAIVYRDYPANELSKIHQKIRDDIIRFEEAEDPFAPRKLGVLAPKRVIIVIEPSIKIKKGQEVFKGPLFSKLSYEWKTKNIIPLLVNRPLCFEDRFTDFLIIGVPSKNYIPKELLGYFTGYSSVDEYNLPSKLSVETSSWLLLDTYGQLFARGTWLTPYVTDFDVHLLYDFVVLN